MKKQIPIPILKIEKETDLVLLIDSSGKSIEYAIRTDKKSRQKVSVYEGN